MHKNVLLLTSFLFILTLSISSANAFMLDMWWGWMGMGAGFGIGVIVFVVIFILWIWALIDALQREFKAPNDKLIWIIILILTFIVGVVLYYFLVKSKDYARVPVRAVQKEFAPKKLVKRKR